MFASSISTLTMFICMFSHLLPFSLFFFTFCHPSLFIFLVVWHCHFVATYWSVCTHHVAAIGISGRTHLDTFLCHCMSSCMVTMMKYEYYIIVSVFLPVTTMPEYQLSLLKCLVLFEDRTDSYASLRTCENTIIWVRRTGRIVVLSTPLVMRCWLPYRHEPTHKRCSV